MAVLHLMVGLPGSGKTTYANAKKEELRAVVLTPDVWQLTLFGDDFGSPQHDERHTAIEVLLWQTAKELLSIGTNVILDFGLWAKEERDAFRAEAEALGAKVKLHYMDTPWEELFRRVELRSRQDHQYDISEQDLRGWWDSFEVPTSEELAK